jgi:hypothetical protein
MKSNRFAAINDSPILAQVPNGALPERSTCDMRSALNFRPYDSDPSFIAPVAQVASYLHCDLAEFLGRQQNT